MTIPVGISHSESVVVDASNIASAVGSGLVDVYATPMMIALLELAAAKCVESHLEPGMVTVGVNVDVTHSDATPIGMKVTAVATVSAVDRRRVDFEIVVSDDAGEVGRGVHTRFVVDKEKFTQKALAKKA